MPKGYHHVTRDQRCQIYALKSMGLSLGKIGKKIGVHVSTVSRELRRNRGERGYRYHQADCKAVSRRSQASRTPKKLNEEMCQQIEHGLMLDWSPEQIAGRLGLENNPISSVD